MKITGTKTLKNYPTPTCFSSSAVCTIYRPRVFVLCWGEQWRSWGVCGVMESGWESREKAGLNEEAEDVEELKQHLEIVPDKDDDLYIEATPLARKVPVVDYQIVHFNNKPYYKIICADGTHQLYVNFITLRKNFDREDLELLWSIVKERFSTSKPNNFSDDFLLTTLKAMFGRPDGQDQVWMSQRSVHDYACRKKISTLEVYIGSNAEYNTTKSGRAE
nr:hypothetical protein [Tanacetum cinerariifolium]